MIAPAHGTLPYISTRRSLAAAKPVAIFGTVRVRIASGLVSRVQEKSLVSPRWSIDPADRRNLLALVLPRYPVVLATALECGSAREWTTPDRKAVVIGQADDPAGVQTLIVSLDGAIFCSHGRLNHIIWSLGQDRFFNPPRSLCPTHWEPLPINVAFRLRRHSPGRRELN